MEIMIVCLLMFTIPSVYSNVQAGFHNCSAVETCRPHYDCEDVTNLTNKGRLTSEDKVYLKSKFCNKTGNIHHFCCSSVRSVAPQQPQHLPRAPECGVYFNDILLRLENTYIDEHPWFALIQYTKPENEIGHHCGGSLISKRFVLTAAQCEREVPSTWKLSKVRLGEWDIRTNPDCENFAMEDICNEPYVEVPVAEVIVHPEYYSNGVAKYNDIALLKLEHDVQFTEWIRPICLPIDSIIRNMDFTGQEIEIAGFGMIDSNFTSPIKKRFSLDALSQTECQARYSSKDINIQNIHTCALCHEERRSCKIDFGGPLMKYKRFSNSNIPTYMLVGVSSFKSATVANQTFPGVYTRVSEYMDWIIDNTK